MIPLADKIILLVHPLAIAASLVYCVGLMRRWRLNSRIHTVGIGLLFGCAALISMSNPIPVSDGVIVDQRNLYVGLAGALFGWVAGLITFGMAAAMRLHLGGAGVYAGLTGLLLGLTAGLLWRAVVATRVGSPIKGHAILGLMINIHLLAAFVLPTDIAVRFLTTTAPMLIVFNFIGAVLLGGMIERENLLTEETLRLRSEAMTDPLTKLMNRRHLERAFGRLPPPEGTGRGHAMLYFDVDLFKSINDTFGHAAGDQVLRVISERAAACLRPQDLFSRLGGDEFLIVLPDIDAEDARMVAERCQRKISEDPVAFGQDLIAVSVSVGVNWRAGEPEFATDLARADEALYRAKRQPRLTSETTPSQPRVVMVA